MDTRQGANEEVPITTNYTGTAENRLSTSGIS